MTLNELPAFSSLIIGVGEITGRKEPLSEAGIEIYFNALKQFDLADLKLAFNAHVLDPDAGQFFPKPADIVRHLKGNTKTQALSAWSKVDKAIRHVGQYQSVCFDDPVIHKVIEDMGGWIALCSTPTEKELAFKCNEFENRYRGYSNKNPEYPRLLLGLADAENIRHGFDAKPPVIIGDERLALMCYQGGSEAGGSSIKRISDFSVMNCGVKLLENV